MENKKVLGKIIPAVLVLVLALLLVITISSCSKGKKTPVGAIEDVDNYLKIDLADDETYSLSKLEFYNKLRYTGYDVFEDALVEAALKEYVDKIKKDIEDNSSNLENATYYKRFKYIIDAEVYGTSDEDSIADFKDDEKAKNEKNYLNNISQIGYDVDKTKGIYQKASLEYQTIKLAKREYARSVLLKDIEDEDSENKITDKKIEDFFTKKIANKNDFSALLILFSSQTEIEEALMQLNLKFIGSKLYRVSADDAEYENDSDRKFSEYKEYYDDFDSGKLGVAPLDDNEVLFELCRMYNYIYSYRAQLTFEIGGVDYLDSTAHPYNPLQVPYTTSEYEDIKNMSLEDMVQLIIAQDKGDIKTSPRINYDYKTVYDIDSTLQSALYKTYLYDSKENARYNTPSSTFAKGNYLTFKLKDATEITYKSVKVLAQLQDSQTDGSSEKAVKAIIETIREEYSDTLKGMKIYEDDAKVKAWALDYASKVTALDITGAKEIIDSINNQEKIDSIWSKVFEEMLTDDYISEKLDEYLEDECKITIYDSLFEVQFAQKHDYYKAGNKTSKQNVLKVKVNGVENVITAEDMFERLEKKYGANQASNILFYQILKDKYYSRITDVKKKEYEKEYEQIITYFAQGNSTQYGYSPSIGQKAFMNLYFKAETKDEAIFNMWVVAELQKVLLTENATVINSNMFDYFSTLTNVNVNDYAHLEYNLIYVYTDDDEDGEADDWTKVDDTDARKQEVMQLAAELINIINERAMNEFSNSNRDGAYNSLYSKYQASSRISTIGNYGDGATVPTEGFKTTNEQDAFYFAKYKAKGLFLAEDISKIINGVSEVLELDDDNYENQIKFIYKYMIENYSTELTVDKIFARELVEEDSGANIDKAEKTNLFEFEKGFGTIYLVNTTKAPSFKFEVKDNADTSTGSKVYPYSINEDDPFPVDEDKKPIDNTGAEDSLYNTTDKITKNQILMYVKEYSDGVESLSLDVINAFKAYFEEDIMKTYLSDSFRYYISKSLIDSYISEGKITISNELKAGIDSLTASKQEALFEYKESAFITKWFELFK